MKDKSKLNGKAVMNKPTAKVEVEMISPAQATIYLLKNTINRPMSERNLRHIENEINNGKWIMTTDAIGFDEQGNLNNGQHRLQAVINTGKTLQFLVSRGMDMKAFNVIDTGKGRSSGDVLGANGVVAGTSKSAIIKFVNGFRKGQFSIHKAGKDYAMDNQDVLDFYNRHKDKVEEAYDISVEVTNNFKGLKGRTAGGMYYILSAKDRDVATAFFQRLGTSIGLKGQDDPIFVLRKKLMEDVTARKKNPEKDKLAWLILSWNSHRRGKAMKQLRYNPETEKFPDPF